MRPPTKKKRPCNDLLASSYGGFKSDKAHRAESAGQAYQKRQSSRQKLDSSKSRKTLDYEWFLSLNQSTMESVCRSLDPLDLLTLARTSRRLREIFMSRGSQSYWDAARYITGTPDWPTIAAPAAASFFYESGCQGYSCDSEEPTFSALHLCRRYCPNCAPKHLLAIAQAVTQYPTVPHYMVAHLPWNSYRVYPPTSAIDKGRYYLKSDIERLDRRIKLQKASKVQTTGELRHELAVFQKERQTATKKIDQWYAGLKRRRQSKFNQRWAIVSDTMRSRWGWTSVPYEELGPRMRHIVDWLLNAPVLSEAEWMYVQGDLKWAIRDEAKVRSITQEPRQFALHSKPQS